MGYQLLVEQNIEDEVQLDAHLYGYTELLKSSFESRNRRLQGACEYHLRIKNASCTHSLIIFLFK